VVEVKYKKFLVIVAISLFLNGCWDRIEIDRKIFISIIGVDVGKDIGKEEELKSISSNKPFAEREIQKMKVTYGFPDISSFSPSKGGNPDGKFITVSAYSMEDSVVQTSSKSSRSLDMGHSSILILSDEMLSHSNTVKEVLDYLKRQPNINRTMLVVVIEGNVEDYIKFKPDMEKSVDIYITGLMENSSTNATILPVTLNEMLSMLSENGNAIVPRISLNKTKKELTLSGIAVIKDYTIKGYLDPIETSDIEILRGKLESGKKVVYKDGHPVDFSIEDIKRKMKVGSNNGNINVNIDINLEGQLKGYYVNEKVISKENLNELEKNFNESISKECEKVIKITQNKFMMDPIGISQHIKKYSPGLWNKVKDNWDEEYKRIIVKVTVTTHIKRIGLTK
jgi:spore germination protein